jgi:2-keto-4-pentenoate hydratase
MNDHTAPIGREHWRPIDFSDARLAAAYRDMAEAWRAAGPLRGWKIAAGAVQMRRQLGIASALIGFVSAGAELAPGEAVDLTGAAAPGVEAELAIHIGRDVRADASDAELAAAIDGLGLSAEIIDVRGDFTDLVHLLATNSFSRAFVFSPVQPAPIRLPPDSALAISLNDRAIFAAKPFERLGDLRWVVRFVAAALEANGESLRAGQVISSGLLTPAPIWVGPGDAVSIEAGALGRLDLTFAAVATSDQTATMAGRRESPLSSAGRGR